MKLKAMDHHATASTLRSVIEPRDALSALWKGMRGRCPRCGQGKLFRAYLKVADHCPSCGEPLFHQRSDDAAPWGVMLIVCHIVVAGVLMMEQTWAPPLWLTLAIWFPITIALCLLLLPVVKGAVRRAPVGFPHAWLRRRPGSSRSAA